MSRLVLAACCAVGSLAAQEPIAFTARHAVTDAAASPDGRTVAYTLRSADRVRDEFRSMVFLVPIDGGSPRQLGPGRAVAFGPDGALTARLMPRDGMDQVVVRDSVAGADRILTDAALGVAGFRLSPDGSQLAYLADASPVLRHVRAFDGGDANARLALFIVPVAGGTARRISSDDLLLGAAEPEQPGDMPFDWLDDSTLVVSGRVTGSGELREAASLQLVDAASGTHRYFLGTGGRWVDPVVSPDREWIAFTGQPVGGGPWPAAELIAVRRNGSGLVRLTAGLDRSVGDVAWSGDSRSIWYATEDRGTRNLHRVELRNGRETARTTGTHSLVLAAVTRRGDQLLAIQRTPTSAGSLLRIAERRPEAMQPLVVPDAEPAVGELEQFEVRAPDGTLVDAWLHRPPGFALGQSAPLLVDIHGGPHAMAGAGYAPWALAHAAAGWLVLRANPRGSMGFGFDIANGLGRDWPGRDVRDLSLVIDDLVARGLVDTTRIAVVGTGAGAVTATALAASDLRIGRAILRCPGGAWLPGGTGYDPPLWSEWHAARPFRMAPALWRRQSPVERPDNRIVPSLILESVPSAPDLIGFAEAMHVTLGLGGVMSRFIRIPGTCRDAGPATQAELLTMEQAWLTTAIRR
ncbi:MAG TPA: prolyl oligopeptidase family serine peptidase [Gemmatimonadales bacterium]|nr:prolyl oligopeptidase family serine peptidase [Gemmatimonadales bacterium]HRX17788.1 prolyl oligopeptidase family serine peptidase [Gemmatimonadales bacterium]